MKPVDRSRVKSTPGRMLLIGELPAPSEPVTFSYDRLQTG